MIVLWIFSWLGKRELQRWMNKYKQKGETTSFEYVYVLVF